ncbi:MAG: ABC transporter permease [Bacteroidota bacterium]
MDLLLNWPWEESLITVVIVNSLFLLFILLSIKYPSGRFLGILTGSFLITSLVSIIPATSQFIQTAIIVELFSFLLYLNAFFTQSSRINLRLIIPVVLILALQVSTLANSFIVTITIFTILLLYIFLVVKLLRQEARRRGFRWFQNPGQRLVWLRGFCLLFFAIVIIKLGVIIADIDYPVYIHLGTLTLLGFCNVRIIRDSTFLTPIPLGTKYQKSTLTREQKYTILKKLDSLIEEEKFYLNSSNSLSGLAGKLQTTTHHLSQVINENKGMSFQEMIGKLRINEAKKILKDPSRQDIKIESIATIVGYNSKSAFNTAFKKLTGVTPSQFKEQKNVLSDREEHLPERKKPRYGKKTVDLNHVSFIKHLFIMVSNFFKVFVRTARKNMVFTSINLFGLIMGFTACILIYFFIADELSYDKSLPDSDQVYRIAWQGNNPQTRTPHPMAQAMVSDLPEVVAATTLSPWYGNGLNKQSIRVKYIVENKLFEEPDFYFVDSTFLDVFQLELVAGDAKALSKPWNIVISDQLAKKYFGDDDPIGKQLSVNDMFVDVAAVIKSMPENSHFHFNALISYVTIKSINPGNPWMKWGDFGHFNYIKLAESTDYKQLEASIPGWVAKYLNWDATQLENLREENEKFILQPIADIHLHSHLRWELENNGNVLYIYILSGTMIFILLIIIINYVNLTTSKSFERAKEIGIRKTLGAISRSLTMQFYLESALFCFVALVGAFVLVSLLIEPFNMYTGKEIQLSALAEWSFLLPMAGIFLLIAFISGFYPALALSSFIPSDVLKGKLSNSLQGLRMHSILVVVQFCVSAILIISSLIILKQLNYIKSKDLGFDQDALISIRIFPSAKIGGIDIQQVRNLRTEFEKISGVEGTTAVSNLPGGQFDQHNVFNSNQPDENQDVSEMYVSYDFEKVFEFELLEGRSFDNSFAIDSAGKSVIVNESFVKNLNLKEAIGTKISWNSNKLDRKTDVTIVGVLKDFHYRPLHEEIQPVAIQLSEQDVDYILIKLAGNRFQQTLTEMEQVYSQYEKDMPFEYNFLDQKIANLYNDEIKTLNVFTIFGILALILACLGLFGMAIAMMNQKVKEVGIRKILGASPVQILTMILSQFSRLIGISLLIGLPIGYLLMQNWMSEFSYQATIGLLPFLLASVALLVVAFTSVSAVVIKIARSNPIDAVKYE